MRKLAALQLTVLFSALYLAACSNSTSEYLEEDPSGSEDKVVPSDTTEIEGMIVVRGGTVRGG